MCGIFGAVFTRPGDRVEVEAALRSIAYRGPDESRIFRTSGAILGHNRLRIIDLSAAASQPMVSEDRNVAVVFNGEIYNHHALRADLVGLGHRFRSRSDTEVIVEGYRAWGDSVVDRLDGMFAIGIFDARAQRLLLARDRTGKKPLYYSRKGGGLRFASEAKAIFASGVSAEMDVSALPNLLAFGYTPAPQSMYRDVVQLPPASMLVLESEREPVVRRYWRAPFAEPQLKPSVTEACSRVRQLTEEAVKRRLEADVPLGAFLSGGVDSTVIVGIMSRLLGRKVKTFSIGFAGDPRFDETHFARIAARAFDTDHTEFTLEPSSFDLVERLVESHDGPFGDSSAIPTSIVSQLTRKEVTVAMSGDGGDELFCGYPRFLAAEAEEKVPALLRRAAGGLARLDECRRRLLSVRGKRLLARAALSLPARLAAWNSYFTFELGAMLTPDVRSKVDIDEPLSFTERVLAESKGAAVLTRILDHNFHTYLPYDLLVKGDRASMIHSLELRSPFLDKDLIEYASRLPGSMLRRGTAMKWILKRAFSDIIPDEIKKRGKLGFGMPLGTWFRNDLRPYLLDHFNDRAEIFQYLDRPFVRRLLTEHFDGVANHSNRLWLLLTVQLWLRSLSRK